MSDSDPRAGGWAPENELIVTRNDKAAALREAGANPYANGFTPSHTAAQIFSQYGQLDHATLDADPLAVAVAGRLRLRRVMGKASFLKIQDWSVRPGIKPAGLTAGGEAVPATDDFLQLFVKANAVGAEAYQLVKSQLDLGDFVAARGRLMRTKTGEVTVQVEAFELLTKSIRPLPDKWAGLSDMETRFRRRYVDFAINPRAREVMRIRSEVVHLLRAFFHQRDYLEVETPILHPTPGGAVARPFRTHHNALDLELFLRIAPELYLKRLLVGGFGRVFELGRVFRNEGLSRQHNPEFTMLEFYQAYATYADLMDLTETLLSGIAAAIHGAMTVTYAGQTLDLSPPWARITVSQAVSERLAVDTRDLADRPTLEALGRRVGLSDETMTPLSDGKLLMEVFDKAVQPHLVQPTFVTRYPADVSPLSRRSDDDATRVDRFELFIAGNEIANGFSELNDPVDQHGRFAKQLEAKAAGDEEAHPMDADYVQALEYGMPPAAGEGIGVDRLVMLLADAPSIREVIAFPQLRPEAPTGASTSE